jgi:hypothetical protein
MFEGERSLGRPRCKWENNIRIDIWEIRVGKYGLDASGSQVPVADSCERGNEPSDSVRGGVFLDELSDYQLLKKYCVPWSYSVRILGETDISQGFCFLNSAK